MRDISWGYSRFSLLFPVAVVVALCVSSSGTTATAVCAPGRVAVVVDGKHLCRAAADLRVRVVGLPTETRIGGNLSYLVTVSNIGRRTAKGVAVNLDGGAALLLSLSSARSSCSSAGTPGVETELAAACSTASLAPHEKVSIELSARAIVLGRIVLHVIATSETSEVGVRNNVASVATSVVRPDSVHVVASRNFAGHPYIGLTLDAISGRHGEDPEGTFVLDWEGHVAGHVTCLSVAGNAAYVGGAIDEPNTPLPPDVTPTPY